VLRDQTVELLGGREQRGLRAVTYHLRHRPGNGLLQAAQVCCFAAAMEREAGACYVSLVFRESVRVEIKNTVFESGF